MADLPVDRTTANTPAEHVADHNALHATHNLIDGDGSNGQVLTRVGGVPTWAAPSGSYGSTRAYRATSAQTLTTSTHTAIALNAEDFDDDTLHDNSTNPSRFTIVTTGRYELVGQIQYATTSATGTRHAVIWKNGTGTGTRLAAANIPGQTSTNPRVQVSTGVISLTAGDYVELGGWQDSTANLDVSFGADLTWLSLRRIS